MKNRALSLILVAAMLLGLVPAALAARLDEVSEIPAEDALMRVLPVAEDQGVAPADGDAVVELAETTTPDGNLCRPSDGARVTATASSEEADSVCAANAIDGDNTSKSSRWGSAVGNGPHSIKIDLGVQRSVSVVKIFWERCNILAYTLEGSTDDQNWTSLYTCTSEITNVNETLTFEPVTIRYLNLNITSHKSTGLKGDGTESVDWNTVSLFEIEVYRDENAIPQAASDVLANIISSQAMFAIDQDGKLILNPDIAVPANFTVTFAANLEQVVGEDGTIYTPVVNKQVAFDLTVADNNNPDNIASTAANAPILVTIPGSHVANEGNAKPAVIPEIMEWYSSAAQDGQSFTLTANSRIVAPTELNGVANEVKKDVQDLFGLELLVVSGTPRAGDVVLTLGSGAQVAGFDDETYRMEVTDRVIVTAKAAQGAYWATRTLLQGLKLSGEERSFPQGSLRDYPEFKLRGFVMDVGRKPQSMDTLYNIVKNMAWYKLNDFHVHLNDNLIFMEDYGITADNYTDPAIYAQANDAYAAFRLESDIQEEEGGNPLTAKDYAYTKAEFKQFISDSAAVGINIVPEFDVPAHAKSIADAFPSLRLQNVWGGEWGYTHPANCHLDLINKYDESLSVVQQIFDEYLDENDPVFTGDVIHFGADEYFGGGTPYRKFMRDMIAYVREKGYTPRIWGSLSHRMIASTDPDLQFNDVELNKGVQLNIWNTGWANPTVMYNKGFDLINVTDGPFYMVPNGGGGRGVYGDYLNLTDIYAKAPNNIGGTWFPASSSQILGESFAIWMDNIDTRAAGLDEVDTFARFFDTLPVVAVRQWGVENNTPARTLTELQADIAIIGTAPQTDPYYYGTDESDFFTYDFSDNTDKSGNGHDLTLTNAEINSSKSLLVLKGGASYAETGLDRLGWGSQLSFRALKLAGGGEEEVLFEADHAYGDFSIKALPVEGKDNVWKLGFSRELYDYEFDVELPVGQWVKLTLTNEKQSTKLSVDGGAAVAAVGKFVSKPDSNTQFQGKTGINYSSFELPVARIGSKTNAFTGYIAAVSTGEPIDIPFMTASSPSFNNDGIPFKAIDGDPSTIYHSNWNSPKDTNGEYFADLPADQRYIQLDLTTPVTLSGLKYLRRQSGTNGYITDYDIRVSTDGETYTSVKTGSGWSGSNDWDTATFTPQSGVVSVRLYSTAASASFMAVAELELIYEPIDLEAANATVTVGDVTWGETEATAEITVALESGFVLTEGTDYEVTYTGNTAAGTATAIVTGIGGYTGTLTATFTVPAKPAVVDLSTATVTFAQTSYHLEDGKAEPEPIVKVGNTTLLRGLDYTVTYANNTAPGQATVTVTGMGNCVGSAQASFTILSDTVRDLSDATVTLAQSSYPLVNGKAEPEPVVTLDGTRLTKGTDYTLTYADNTAAGTATVTVVGTGNYTGRVTVAFIVTGGSSGDTGNTGNTGSSGTAASGRTEQEVRSDGSVLVTTTDRVTGTETGTAEYPDGTVVESVTTIGGVTTAKVTLAEGTQTATVIIPTATTPGIGQVAVITHPDGTREVIKTSLPTEEGLAITVSEDTRVKLIDNTKHFVDVPEGHWGEEAITFVTSREIFNGTGSGTFSPSGAMSRAMVCTVLANLEGVDVSGGETWYEKAVEWAKEQKVSDGSNPNALVTREQLVSILYRYAGSPATYRDLKGFTDADQVSSWAAIPMAWAIQKGIITGRSDGSLDPKTGASRAEVAVVFQRYLMGAGK